MSKVFNQISSGEHWDLRLHRNGRFSLRWNIVSTEEPDGATSLSYNHRTGKSPEDLAAVLVNEFCGFPDDLVLPVRQALFDAQAYQGDANALQSAHSEKIRRANVAAKFQRESADLDAIMSELRGFSYEEGAQ